VSPASGAGNGTVTLSETANTSGTARPATVTIAGSTAVLTQSGTVAAVIRSVTMSTLTTFAIAGATTVRFDVLGSSDSLGMDFGDGTSSNAPGGCLPTTCLFFEHRYSTPLGTRTAILTATQGGAQRTATAAVIVGDLTGTWSNTVLNPSNGRTETRRLVLNGGGSFSGSYVHPEGDSEPLTGTVNSFGSVNLRLNSGTISMQGIDLDSAGVRSDTSIRLTVTGGSAHGMTLTFTKQ
jgi:hypothetical protein